MFFNIIYIMKFFFKLYIRNFSHSNNNTFIYLFIKIYIFIYLHYYILFI